MFTEQILPLRNSGLVDGDIPSFTIKERKQLAYVTGKSLVDAAKLPDTAQLAKLYQKDLALTQERIEQVCEAYEKKIATFWDCQNSVG